MQLLPQKLLHGGDYNPDQWLKYPEILEEDIRLMKEAHVNCVSLGIFAWATLEPDEGRYELDWLEKIIDRLYAEGIYTILATPTAARPLWLASKYEETRQVLSNGIRKLPGQRHNMCPSSPVMREKMRNIDGALAERFGEKEAVIAWHISNEYAGGGGDHGDGACYCPLCQSAFRKWLKDRYKTLDALNEAWWAPFWSNTVTEWEQINAPTEIGSFTLLGQRLDWKRFTSDQLLDFCKEEIRTVKAYGNKPCTTNLMGFFEPLDYFKWAKELDFTSIDSYPGWHCGDDVSTAMMAAVGYDLTRSLKKQPFFLMESVTSAVGWMSRNPLKRPGMHMLSSLQAVAHGSDSVCYFQWRKSRGSCEKCHGAVIDHKNGSNTRTFKDVTEVGLRLEALGIHVLNTVNKPRLAIVYDWENVWAVSSTPYLLTPFPFAEKWMPYYKALWELGIGCDIINMDDDLSSYDTVIAPINYMYRGDYTENVRNFVRRGGTYITTYYSGEVNENDLCFLGGHPLSDVLGIRTEEIDVRPEAVKNYVKAGATAAEAGEAWRQVYEIRDLCAVIHAETADVMAEYTDDFYAGMPALTRNIYGKGQAWFIAAECEDAFIRNVYRRAIQKDELYASVADELPHGVSATKRVDTDGREICYLMNFNNIDTEVNLCRNFRVIDPVKDAATAFKNAAGNENVRLTLKPYEVILIEEQ